MPERRSGRPRRGGGSRRRTPTAASVRCPAVSAFVPKRLIVTWNGSGRPSSRSAIASPSSTSADTSSPCTTSTISDARSVMSARLRVKIRTSSPARCTWIRAPSSFHSTLARPNRSSAADTSSAVWASIGVIGCSGVSRKRPSPSTPSRIAAAATLGRSPASIAARRTAAAGTPAAFATASAITPSSAPCRSSPRNSPTSRRRSGSVAREKRPSSSLRRAACEPGPAIDCRRDTAASTSSSSSVGDSAAGRKLAKRRPPDADRALRERARQVRDGDRDLVGAREREAVREPGDLSEARRGRRDVLRCLRDLREEHGRHSSVPLSCASHRAGVERSQGTDHRARIRKESS